VATTETKGRKSSANWIFLPAVSVSYKELNHRGLIKGDCSFASTTPECTASRREQVPA